MTGVDFNVWAERLTAGYEVVRREARFLGAEDGPFRRPLSELNQGTWTGAAADHFRSLLIALDRNHLYPLAEHLARLATALERLHDEVSLAVHAERMGTCPVHVPDILTELAPWRSCPYYSNVLPPGWEYLPSGQQISMDIEGVRETARTLDDSGDALMASRGRLARGLDDLGIEPFDILKMLAVAAHDLGDNIRRRADAMAEADRRAAAEARCLADALTPLAGVGRPHPSPNRQCKRRDELAEHRRIANDPRAPLADRYEANRWLIRSEIDRLRAKCEKNSRKIAEYTRQAYGNPQLVTAVAWLHRENFSFEQKMARYQGWADDSNRHFLLFDPKGDGRIAEVFGDLQAADNVAVIVPGMNNEMSNYDTHLRPAGQNVLSAAPNPSTATITWLGYDTPEGVDGASAVETRRGGKALAKFVKGLSSYGEKHTTVIGHSYGTTVVANAAASHGMSADDLVFVGSPGLGIAPNATMGDARLWYGDTNSDFVVNWLRPIHGPGPADWGAKRFSTDLSHGHSEYFRDNTESVRNIARITDGMPPTLR